MIRLSKDIKKFSVSKEGNVKLTKHFTVREFACKDGSDAVLISNNLAWYLEQIRLHFGKPVHINSAYRTKAYNKKVGGANYSQHPKGTAADITVEGVSPTKVADYAESIGMGGVGRYATFTHVDVRRWKARWRG